MKPCGIRKQYGWAGGGGAPGLTRLLGLLACLSLWGRCEPRISSALLRFGSSPVIPAYSWATLQYRLANPADKKKTK